MSDADTSPVAAEPVPVSQVEVLASEAEASEDQSTADLLEVRDRKFTLVDKVPAMTMLKLSAAADPKTPVPAQMGAIASFLHKIVVPDERDDFLQYLEDAEPVIEFDELNEVLTRATEVIGGRPT